MTTGGHLAIVDAFPVAEDLPCYGKEIIRD
jgi:hypothetical protein